MAMLDGYYLLVRKSHLNVLINRLKNKLIFKCWESKMSWGQVQFFPKKINWKEHLSNLKEKDGNVGTTVDDIFLLCWLL